MNKIVSVFLVLTLAFNCPVVKIVYADDNSGDEEIQQNDVNDGDKASARYGNLITSGVEAANIVEDVSKGKAAVDEAKKVAEKYKQEGLTGFTSDLKNLATDAWFKYKSSKTSLLTMLNRTQKHISKIIEQASDRVNMWRTTVPTLQAYYNNAKKLTDDTKTVFTDFKFSDLYDIDRKWDKRFEANIKNYGDLAQSFLSYLNSKDPDYVKSKYYMNLMVEDDDWNGLMYDELATAAAANLVQTCEFRKVPFQTLVVVGESLTQIRDINSKAKGPAENDPSQTQEGYDDAYIYDKLNDGTLTHEDTRELGAFIQQKRAQVAVQATQIKQIRTILTTRYARLLLRKKETNTQILAQYYETLNKLCNDGEYKTIDEQRRSRLQSDVLD